ncbi:hypothetical protein DNTS_001463 [Danionella cerebrum]|uniref:Calponin-homology (CH) domain-containing protein n=1 Tax=Danionella cerebrum TaxID=2873325 RepID=A0A553R4D9_9TELE|nr:hypothetical protein DNTS_001463 [Danionella translucida]
MASGSALIFDEEMCRYSLLWPDEEYLEAVKRTPEMSLEELKAFSMKFNDVYFHQNIYHCGRLAVGATLELVDAVMKKVVRNGLALVRPPGHHGQFSAACGFCVFNNVAIAAYYAKEKYNLNRVLIVDWDVHHGQGIQYSFEEDPSVLYFSWHRFENQSFWPNLTESDYTSVGMTNSDYLAAFFHILLPVAYQGEMYASPEIFAHLTQLLMPLAEGKLCVVLEGGYNLTSLSQSVCQTVQTLLGDPCPRLLGLGCACDSALESIENVQSIHSSYWSCFQHLEAETETRSKLPRLSQKVEEPPETLKKNTKSVDVAWPEPLARTAAPLRTLVAAPAGLDVTLQNGCQRLGDASESTAKEVQSIWEKHFPDYTDKGVLQSFGNITSVLDQIINKEVCNGCVVVSDATLCSRWVFQHTKLSQFERVFVVFVGDGKVPVKTNSGKVFVVQICAAEPEDQSDGHLSLCLRAGKGFVAGLMQVVFSLVLPLAYEFNPGFVLMVCGESEVKNSIASAWGHMTCLLQGIAEGHTLALLQDCDGALLESTVSALSGTPLISLGVPEAPNLVDLQMIEKQRQRLQKHWSILRSKAPPLGDNGHFHSFSTRAFSSGVFETTDLTAELMATNPPRASPQPVKMKKEESLLGKLGGTLVRKKKLKEEENAERTILDPSSREDINFKDLQKVLIDWINSELEEERIIVKDLEEDLYDGQVLQKLFEKLSGCKLNVAEVTQSEIGQKQKLQTLLESVNATLRPLHWSSEWSVDAIHSKSLVSIIYLLLALAIYYAAPIRLPEHVSVQIITVTKKEGILHTAHVTKQLTSTTTEMMIGRSERDAFDTLLDHAPDKLNVVKTSLITFVNKHLNKLNLEVTELDTQFADGVYLVLLMGLLENYFVPLYNFYLTPESFEQKVHNVAFAFELMQDGGLQKPKARPEDVVNLNLKSTLRVLYNLFTNYKNSD